MKPPIAKSPEISILKTHPFPDNTSRHRVPPFPVSHAYRWNKINTQAKFLRKVYLTSVLIRHFRGWNRVTEKGQRLTLRADRASRLRDRDRAHRALQWWAARARKKRFLARQWINGGMWLRLRVKTRQVVKMFVVLRYVTVLGICKPFDIRTVSGHVVRLFLVFLFRKGSAYGFYSLAHLDIKRVSAKMRTGGLVR